MLIFEKVLIIARVRYFKSLKYIFSVNFNPCDFDFQAQQNMSESSQKLDLIRHALEIHRQQLPPESSIAGDLKAEIEATQTMSPGSMTFTNLGDPFSTSSQPSMSRSASQRSSTSFSRPSSVTGKLEVRLMGCQDLLEEVPGRSRKDQGVFSSPSDAKSWYKLKPSSSKSYSIKDETSSEWNLEKTKRFKSLAREEYFDLFFSLNLLIIW